MNTLENQLVALIVDDRAHGNENWEFEENGLMKKRYASINDQPIAASERKFHWPQGRRPDEHPGLSELGL